MKILSSRAYTLIEMTVTVAVLGVIASSSFAVLSHVNQKAKDEVLRSDVATLNRAVQVYLAGGGNLDSKDTAQRVLNTLKKKAKGDIANRMPGVSSSMIDPRIWVEMQTRKEGRSDVQRAYWDHAAMRFTIANNGAKGIKEFVLSDERGELAQKYEKRNASMLFAASDGWVWDFQDHDQAERSVPTFNVTTNVPDPGAPDPIVPTDPPAPPSMGTLSAPQMSVPGGTYPISDYNLAVTLLDSNPAGAAQLQYSFNNGGWLVYSGTPIQVLPEVVLQARAVPVDPAVYGNSSVANEEYLVNPEALLAPYVIPSSSEFTAAQPTVEVSIANPNGPAESRVDYRINGGNWATYGAPFSLNSTDYPAGAIIEAVAVATTPHYLNSVAASAPIYEVSSVELLPPVVIPSASEFTTGESTVDVSITNFNDPAISRIDYRVNGGAWTVYVSPFTLDSTTFPDGATVEAMAVATAPYYLDSSVASTSIGAPPPNEPPFAAVDGYSRIYTYTGTTPVITTTVFVNDWDPDGDPLTVVGVTDGAHGTVTIDGTGNPLFTSSPTFIDGNDSFTYTISDGRGGTATATVTIMVNAKPVTANETVTTMMDTPVSGNVLANDWDHGGAPLIVEDNENPLAGIVSIGADGNFTYTPNGGFTGTDSFRYTVADDESGQTYGFVNIIVNPPPVIQNLAAPQISMPGGTYPITDFNLSVTLVDPNPAGTSRLMYRLNSAAWQEYTGTPLPVVPNDALEAQAVALDTNLYASSGVATADYQASSIALLPPVITPSASEFSVAQPTVSVSIADANDPAIAQVQYRIEGGVWTPYVGVFPLNSSDYPDGATVESRAEPTAPYYLPSSIVSATIGAAPPPSIVERTTGIDPGSWAASGASATYTFDDDTRVVLTAVGTSWSGGTINSWSAWSKAIDGRPSVEATFDPNDKFTLEVFNAANESISPESIELHFDRIGGSAGSGVFTLEGLTWSSTAGNAGFTATSNTVKTSLSGTNLSGGSAKLNQSTSSLTITNKGNMDRIGLQVTIRVPTG